jgi:hypothetical protein
LHNIAQASLELMILLPQPPECWDYSMHHHTWLYKYLLDELIHTIGPSFSLDPFFMDPGARPLDSSSDEAAACSQNAKLQRTAEGNSMLSRWDLFIFADTSWHWCSSYYRDYTDEG